MIGAFEAHLEAEQRASSHTVTAYIHDLEEFAEFLQTGEETRLQTGEETSLQTGEDLLLVATRNDIREWIGSLGSLGRSAATLRRKLQSLRAFYHWARKTGRLDVNPATDITLPKKKRQLPNFIRESEIEQLLEQRGNGTDFIAERTLMAIELMYSLGLRRAELLALTDNDINFTSGEIRVTGKRNKTRILPMPDALAASIRTWQSLRDSRYPELVHPRPVIAGPHGSLTAENLYIDVRKALAGVSTGRKSPHTLRHSFATAMVNDGADLDTVREMLGHESLATTQIYTHLSLKDLMANYRNAHPRAEASKEGDE